MDTITKTDDVQTIFPQCDKISIDFAILEPAAVDGLVYTHPADFGWSDLGNWNHFMKNWIRTNMIMHT